MTLTVIPALASGLMSPAGAAAAVGVDPTFGTDGMVTTPVRASATSTGVVVQPDGKIVAAGTDVTHNNFAVVRHNLDGTPDDTFGEGGLVTTAVGRGSAATGLIAEPDGSILAIGSTDLTTAFALVRYKTNGELDRNFGTNGVVVTAINSVNSQPTAGLRQADGRLVVAGAASGAGAIVVARYMPDGSLDPEFGTNGIVNTVVARQGMAHAMAIQPDGKLVVVGRADVGPTWQQQYAVLRYNPDGTADRSFGTDGVLIGLLPGSSSSDLRGVAVQPDGKIVAAGTGAGGLAVVRLNPDGTFDRTFGTDGVTSVTVGNWSEGSGLVLQPDGKVVVNGFGGSPQFQFVLARFAPDGHLDQTFGTNGIVTNPADTTGITGKGGYICPTWECIRAVSIQPDGNYVAAGFLEPNPIDDGIDMLTLFRYQKNAASTATTTTTRSTPDPVGAPPPTLSPTGPSGPARPGPASPTAPDGTEFAAQPTSGGNGPQSGALVTAKPVSATTAVKPTIPPSDGRPHDAPSEAASATQDTTPPPSPTEAAQQTSPHRSGSVPSGWLLVALAAAISGVAPVITQRRNNRRT